MIIPDSLIKTPPLFAQASPTPPLAYGPFAVVRGKRKIIGMLLEQYGETLTWFDGDRWRSVGYDKVEVVGEEIHFEDNRGSGIIRGLNLSDAKDLGIDPKRAGLKKEDVITKALLVFQPLSV